MNEFRCKRCGHLLAKEEIIFGQVEIKCYACNELNTITYDYNIQQTYTAELIPAN